MGPVSIMLQLVKDYAFQGKPLWDVQHIFTEWDAEGHCGGWTDIVVLLSKASALGTS